MFIGKKTTSFRKSDTDRRISTILEFLIVVAIDIYQAFLQPYRHAYLFAKLSKIK